jgi:hypothetical protein
MCVRTSSKASTRYGMKAGLASSSGLVLSEMHSSTTITVSAVGFVLALQPTARTACDHLSKSKSTCCCVKVNSEPPSSLPKTPQPAESGPIVSMRRWSLMRWLSLGYLTYLRRVASRRYAELFHVLKIVLEAERQRRRQPPYLCLAAGLTATVSQQR